MTAEQIGLYQAVLDELVANVPTPTAGDAKQGRDPRGHHRAQADLQPPRRVPRRRPTARRPLRQAGPPRGDRRVGLRRRRADPRLHPLRHVGAAPGRTTSARSPACRSPATTAASTAAVRDRLVAEFQNGEGPGAMVLSLKAGGTGLNLTAANHVVLYDRWWNPAVEDQARDRAWRIGQTRTVISHRLVCPGTDRRTGRGGRRRQAAHRQRRCCRGRARSPTSTPTNSRLALGLRPDELLAGGRPMSRPRAQQSQRRRPQQKRPAPIDIWRDPGTPARDRADHRRHRRPALCCDRSATRRCSTVRRPRKYFTTVIQRAAVIAAALALSAEVLVPPEDV